MDGRLRSIDVIAEAFRNHLQSEGDGLTAESSPFVLKRKAAFETFERIGLPVQSDDQWKHTPVESLLEVSLDLGPNHLSGDVSTPAHEGDAILGGEHSRVFFNNGRLSRIENRDSRCSILSLRSVMKGSEGELGSDVVRTFFGRAAKDDSHSFIAMNSAFAADGVVIHIPRNHRVANAIEIIFSADTVTPGAQFPRVLVICEEGGEATVVENYPPASRGNAKRFTNAVSEIFAHAHAQVDHYRINRQELSAHHFSALSIVQHSHSQVQTFALSCGGAIVRNEVNFALEGERCFSQLAGLTLIGEGQHVDNHTVIDHRMPHCESREVYKGVYGGNGSGVFDGTIIVRPDAQKTNAFQSNRAILLTEQAKMYSQPQLKIWADDVKCTHGATVGQLDDEALFYARARGIPEAVARELLLSAFTHEVVGLAKSPQVMHAIDRSVSSQLALLRL